MGVMNVKIEIKRNRIILINQDGGNVAFATFSKKDNPFQYEYLSEQYKKQQNESN